MLTLATIHMSAKTLANHVLANKINHALAVQRTAVWTIAQESLLIDSMIRRFPIPALYFIKSEAGGYTTLDGQQRCNAIADYINGDFSLCEDMEPFHDEEGNECDFSEMAFNQLPEWAQTAICDYSLMINYYENITDEEIAEMFFRLNHGTALTAIELNRVKAKSIKQFQELAKHELIMLAVSDKGRKKYHDENCVMQAWAICHEKDVAFDTRTFRPIVENAVVTETQQDEIEACFDIIMDVYNGLDKTNKEQKRIAKRLLTRTHIVGLTKAIHTALTNGVYSDNNVSVEQLKEWICHFYSGTRSASVCEQYNASFGAGSARSDKVTARIEAILNNMDSYLNSPLEKDAG